MKITYLIAALLGLLFSTASCDRDFEAINTNPVEPSSLEPVYQFSNAQQSSAIPSYHYQGAIVQQINTPYGGVLEGGNHNRINPVNINPTFDDMYSGPIRELTDIIIKIQDDPAYSNLYNMARIWRAYCFQYLVDTYGDVPYASAGKGFIEEQYFPKYEDQQLIYEDILKEYEEATDALDPDGAIVSGDLFYSGDIAKWKKLGNSLLLRAGMRYTEIDEAKASEIVQIATDPSRGGLIDSNEANALIAFNETYTNASSSTILGTERPNYYVGGPFVDFLKSTHDPRLAYIAVKYEIPSNPLSTAGMANTNPEEQEGMPYGYDENSITSAPDFPGKIESAFAYSQFNRSTVFRIDAPEYFITYSQTELLLAEANHRGYIASGTVKEHYEKGIKAHMEQTPLYGEDFHISENEQENYINSSEIAFDPNHALEQISQQYWISSFRIWGEAWANFRRTGYPALSPINFPGEDPSVSGDFIRRLTYPIRELSVNTASVEEAVARMGGNTLGTPLFWDE